MVQDEYSYEKFPALREPARRVTASLLNAMRFMDSTKECVLILSGMPETAKQIHGQAHKYGEYWDVFGDILHQRHLLQEFPATPELGERPDATRAFEIVIACMDEVESALRGFIEAAESENLHPLARAAENLQMLNSDDYTLWLQAADMWERGGMSKTSFEGWIKDLFE